MVLPSLNWTVPLARPGVTLATKMTGSPVRTLVGSTNSWVVVLAAGGGVGVTDGLGVTVGGGGGGGIKHGVIGVGVGVGVVTGVGVGVGDGLTVTATPHAGPLLHRLVVSGLRLVPSAFTR